MIDFAGAPFWKVIAINLLFLTYGTYANKQLTYLRNHVEVDGCCGPEKRIYFHKTYDLT